MRRLFALVPGLLAACGGGGGGADAPIDQPAARCDPSLPFGTPVLVEGINTAQDDASARLSEDELEITFARLSSGVWDLWRATRPATDVAFETPTLLTSVNSVSNDVWPTSSPDGLTLLFDADRTTPNVFHIWRSTRASKTVPFGPPAPRPELMDKDIHPLLANDHALYFSSTVRGGLGLSEILRSAVDANGAIGAPVLLVGGVNTPDLEDSPAVTSDERVIFFRRVIAMESDVFTASRSTPTDGFGVSAAVPGLDVAGINEVPNWISPDGCHLYFHSNVGGGPGGVNVWMTSRPLPPQ
ncbi:MAG: PD40 domain-containing protein [Myxococcales bacterium]|nr:PD40 domain-containing protein [Myxococcales bacterium]